MLPKILIVDDSSDIRLLVKEYLETKFNADWYEADSGNSSINILGKNSFSLIISDLNMPNGSGIYLHQYLLKENIRVPMILFTAEIFDNIRELSPDRVLKAVVSKTKYSDLVSEIKKLNLDIGIMA